MEKLNIKDLNNFIENQKIDVERITARDRKSERIVRMRERDIDEQKILNILCVKRWKQAEEDGKVKYITERKWYLWVRALNLIAHAGIYYVFSFFPKSISSER